MAGRLKNLASGCLSWSSVSFHQWSAPDSDNKDGRGRVTSIPGVIILLLRPPSSGWASDLGANWHSIGTFPGTDEKTVWVLSPLPHQLEYIYKHQAPGWKIEASKKSDIFILKPLSELKLFLSSRKSKILGQRNCSGLGNSAWAVKQLQWVQSPVQTIRN